MSPWCDHYWSKVQLSGIFTWLRTREYSKLYSVEQQLRWIQRNYSSRSSINAILEDLGLGTLEERRQQQHLTLMYKILHGTVALTPADLGLLPAENRTRTTHIHKLRHQGSTTKELLHSFIPRTITEWNRLPASLAEAGSLESFKSQLYKRTPGCLAFAPRSRDTLWSCKLRTRTRTRLQNSGK